MEVVVYSNHQNMHYLLTDTTINTTAIYQLTQIGMYLNMYITVLIIKIYSNTGHFYLYV